MKHGIDSKPVRRRKLSDEIRERLLDLIKAEGMKPGDALPSERELMVLCGVGRPAIREAMQDLQRMGLVSIRHGGRARVAEPSMHMMLEKMGESIHHLLMHSASTIEHLKEARVLFEVEMARMAAVKRDKNDLEVLRNLLKDQEASQDDPHQFIMIDGAFHRAIAAISGNPIFESLSDAMFNWLASFRADLVRKPGLEKLTLQEHHSILSAIEKQNPRIAGQMMSDHLNRANTKYHKTSE
jgi:DNA-binding FadR family transcriptional regulator